MPAMKVSWLRAPAFKKAVGYKGGNAALGPKINQGVFQRQGEGLRHTQCDHHCRHGQRLAIQDSHEERQANPRDRDPHHGEWNAQGRPKSNVLETPSRQTLGKSGPPASGQCKHEPRGISP